MNSTYVQLQKVIANLYNDMLPTAFQMLTVGQGIAGITALMYIFWKVWPVLAGREPLDLFPLMRPFGYMLLLMFFKEFILLIGLVLQPIGDATGRIYAGQYKTVLQLIETKEKILEAQNNSNNPDPAKIDDVEQKKGLDFVEMITSVKESLPKFPSYQIIFSNVMNSLLEFLFYTVSIVISTIRAYFLIVLVTIAPIAIGLSIFPGFERTFMGWIARYIQIWMWAPIASILGALLAKVQILLETRDIERATGGAILDVADLGHLSFLAIGVACYLYVPTMASWVIESSGVGHALGQFNKAGKGAIAAGGALAGTVAGKVSDSFKSQNLIEKYKN